MQDTRQDSCRDRYTLCVTCVAIVWPLELLHCGAEVGFSAPLCVAVGGGASKCEPECPQCMQYTLKNNAKIAHSPGKLRFIASVGLCNQKLFLPAPVPSQAGVKATLKKAGHTHVWNKLFFFEFCPEHEFFFEIFPFPRHKSPFQFRNFWPGQFGGAKCIFRLF